MNDQAKKNTLIMEIYLSFELKILITDINIDLVNISKTSSRVNIEECSRFLYQAYIEVIHGK